MIQEIPIIAVFFAGFLSFFAPCIIPLLPPYFAWLLGVSEDEIKKRNLKLKLLFHSFLLILGFSIIFIILGASASKLGQALAPYRLLAQRIGGVIIILFGLEFVGFLKIFKNYKIGLIKNLFSGVSQKTSSFIVGLTFALAWVACFSPILGSVLVLASFQKTLTGGTILLGVYSLGLAIPFLLTAFFMGLVIEKTKVLAKAVKWINLFSGAILIVLGILLVSDNFYRIVSWLGNL